MVDFVLPFFYCVHGGLTLPNELRKLMVEHNLNVKKVAAMAHVTPTCVYRWLKDGQPKGRPIPPMVLDHLRLRMSQPSGRVLRLGDTWSVK